jgi:hypothetical protein
MVGVVAVRLGAVEQRKTPLTEEAITREEFPELDPVEKEKELLQRVVGVAGSLLLAVAVFAPLLSTPKGPKIALFELAKLDAFILLAVALVALVLCAYDRCGFLWVSGAVGIFEIGSLSHFLYEHSSELFRNGSEVKIGLLGYLEKVLWFNAGADWGAIALLAGTFISLGAAISAGFKKHGLTPAAKLGICLLLLVAAYQACLVLYPNLRYLPFLLRR